MRIAILAPIANSLYSRVVVHLVTAEPGVSVCQVLIRNPWTWRRIRSELRRDGARLVRKAYRKLVLGERYAAQGPRDNLYSLARRCRLPGGSLPDLCRQHGVPCLTVADHNDRQALAALRQTQPDLILFTGGGLIRSELLKLPRWGILNCHMGPLPRYRGMDVVEYPVLECDEGEPELGLTVHYMENGIDTGPILLERRIQTLPGENFAGLRQRLEPQMALIMLEAVRSLRQGTVCVRPQQACEGRQYYVMHPRLYALAERCLAMHS